VKQQQLDAARAAATAAQAQLAVGPGGGWWVPMPPWRRRAPPAIRPRCSSRMRASSRPRRRRLKKAVELGQLVQAAQPLMTSFRFEDVWVTANLKETETATWTPGDSRTYRGRVQGRAFRGHVESLSPRDGGEFSLLPPDNATAISRRWCSDPRAIHLDSPADPKHTLRPGMSVVATIKMH